MVRPAKRATGKSDDALSVRSGIFRAKWIRFTVDDAASTKRRAVSN
jgi:hypothetical protein